MKEIIRYNNSFASKLKGFELDTLEKSCHTIYGLSKDLNLAYVNPSWIEFAKENSLIENFLTVFPLGTSIEKVFTKNSLKDLYIENLNNVLSTKNVWRNEYECSSASEYRYFHQVVYPLKNNNGLIIINSLKVTLQMNEVADRQVYQASEKLYTQTTGLIKQCSNCRRTKRNDTSEIWDWVPAWVEKMPTNISHSYCPTCFDFYWKFYNIK